MNTDLLVSLPFHVIVNNILSHHIVWIRAAKRDGQKKKKKKKKKRGESVDERSPYFLYGYFTTDRTRKVWFLFQCLDLHVSMGIFNRLYCDFSKLIYLRLSQASKKMFMTLFKNSPKFNMLTEIVISENHDRNREKKQIEKIFTKKKCFPKLKTISAHLHRSSDSFEKLWMNSRHPFSQIEQLEIDCPSHTFKSAFFQKNAHHFERNMKRLTLYHIDLDKLVSVNLPIVEYITLHRCTNLIILTGRKLLGLSIAEMSLVSAKKALESAVNLKKLFLLDLNHWNSDSDSELSSWFLHPSFRNQLHELERLNIASFPWDQTLQKNWEAGDFPNRIVSLNVSYSSSSECCPFDSSYDFLELKYLSLRGENLLGSYYKFIPRLKEFRFSHSQTRFGKKVPKPINEDLFRNSNEWTSLEALTLGGISDIEGRNWNPFPNLKSLCLSSLEDSFDEVSFFFSSTDDFSKLESLRIEFCNLISFSSNEGKETNIDFSLNKFRNLKEFEMQYCDNIDDWLFCHISFESLEKLMIRYCRNVTGLGWKEMKKLKLLKITSCENFRNENEFRDQKIFEFDFTSY